jgi:site-specific recombinase XerD
MTATGFWQSQRDLVDWPLLDGFRRAQERRNLSDRTITHRARTLRQLARTVAPRSVLDLDREDLEQWLDDCKLGPRSRYLYLSTLTAFYAWCVDAGHTPENPAERIARPKLPVLVPRPAPADGVVDAYIAGDDRMKAWLALGAYMGLRCKEIAGLRAEDLLLDRDPPMLIVSAPKGSTQRILPLNETAERALKAFGIPARGFLFRNDDGQPMQPGTIGTYIARWLRYCGVDASAHRLRHLFGTTLYQTTRDIRLTQAMLGHADAKTTALYAAFDPGSAADAMRSLTIGQGR